MASETPESSEAPAPQPEELKSSSDVRTGFIQGNTFESKAVEFSVVDGKAIFEGDIVLGTVEEIEELTERVRTGVEELEAQAESEDLRKGVVISGDQFRWKGGTVAFTIDPNLANQARVTDAIRHWRERTPIRFVQRTAANSGVYPDWVNFQDDGSGCNSQVGRRTGRQDLNIAGGCGLGSTIHEIGHAVGLWHEQSREDRDRFVRIEWQNIEDGRQHNFNQHISDGDDVGTYDYGSIMHYPATAFSRNGQPTIVALQLPAGVQMGQRTGLSAGDIRAVRFMYPVRTQSGFLVQSNFGARGNFEMALPRPGGGMAHYWRNNDLPNLPWSGPAAFGGTASIASVSLTQSNFGIPGNLEAVARSGSELLFSWRDSGPTFNWSGTHTIATGVSGNPALVQGNFGTKGNFELVSPLQTGGLAHYWRNNDVAGLPWFGPTRFGGTATYQAVALIQSNYGRPGNLELLARSGDQLLAFWRDSGPSFRWNGPSLIYRGISGRPSLIQSAFGGRGNFEVVVPLATGGLAHFWRNNDLFWMPWSGPTKFGPTGTQFNQVSLIQSNFGAPGNLEVVARGGNQWQFFWRDSGPGFAWNGPSVIA